jgi:cytochrome c oxidase subunit 3
MPTTFTHTPAATERKEPGIGGKPPVTRRPTGGGGGGGDDDWQNPGYGPRELLYRIRLYLFSALAADMLFFALLVVFFFSRQAGLLMDPRTHHFANDWRRVQLPPILNLGTALLLVSSVTMELARHNIFREIDVLEEWLGLGRPALCRTLPWVGATLMLGTLFLAGQGFAWKQLTAQGYAFVHGATPASYFFYLMTGLHACHLLIGVVALILCLTVLGQLKRVEFRQIAIDATAWFWHTMVLTWVILYAVLIFGQ